MCFWKCVPALFAIALLSPLARGQGDAVTNLDLQLVDGTKVNLSEYVKKGPVYLSFWALWCEPCKQELRALKSFAEQHANKGFTILAVNQDSPRSIAKVKAYVRSQGYSFPVALDPNTQIFQHFNGQNLPFSVLIDQSGQVVNTRTGYIPGDEKEIGQEILELLGR
jgi:peroxiredoxin